MWLFTPPPSLLEESALVGLSKSIFTPVGTTDENDAQSPRMYAIYGHKIPPLAPAQLDTLFQYFQNLTQISVTNNRRDCDERICYRPVYVWNGHQPII